MDFLFDKLSAKPHSFKSKLKKFKTMVTIIAFYLSFFNVSSFVYTTETVADTRYQIRVEAPAADVYGKGAKKKIVGEDVDAI